MTIAPEEIARLRALDAERASCHRVIERAQFCDNYTDAHRARVRLDAIDKEAIVALPALLAEIERLQTWPGLMATLDRIYPPDVFPTLPDDPKRDDGARIVSLLREVERLRAEVLRLQQHRTELDCRFVGQYGDSDARHCLDSENPKPCQRCELEMGSDALRADLREALALLREAEYYGMRFSDENAMDWLDRREALRAKHKEHTVNQVLTLKALVKPGKVHPNIAAACGAYDEQGVWRPFPGHLAYCNACFEKVHFAPWRTGQEITAAFGDFTQQHKACK